MKRIWRRWMALVLCLAVLLMTGCGMKTENVRFGAARLGGMYYSFGNAYTELAAQKYKDYTFEVKATAGSSANLRLLDGKYIDLAIAQADLANDAYYGKGNFTDKVYDGYKAVAALYTEACQIVVRGDSDITCLDDLQGKKVSIGEEESGTEKNAKQILQASGLNEELVQMENLNYTQAAKKLEKGEIDAFFCTAGVRTTVIEELAKQCDIRLLDIDDTCVDRMMAAYGFYMPCTIPANTYEGQTEDVKTVGVKSVLLAGDSLSEEMVKKLTALLFEQSRELQYAISVDMQLEESTAVQGVTLPFHPGAAAYYAEHDIEVTAE